MGLLCRVRVEVKSEAGVLARVSNTIAALGGDIVTIDLQDIDDTRAVDDIVVEFPDGTECGAVAEALERADAGKLRFWSPVDEATDPVLKSIRWACSIISGDDVEAKEEATRVIREICGGVDAWIVDVDDNRDMPLINMVARKNAPVVVRVQEMPDQPRLSFTGPGWIAAVPEARLAARRVAILARPDNQTFSATEIERVGAILAVYRQVAMRLPSPVDDDLPEGPWLDVSAG